MGGTRHYEEQQTGALRVPAPAAHLRSWARMAWAQKCLCRRSAAHFGWGAMHGFGSTAEPAVFICAWCTSLTTWRNRCSVQSRHSGLHSAKFRRGAQAKTSYRRHGPTRLDETRHFYAARLRLGTRPSATRPAGWTKVRACTARSVGSVATRCTRGRGEGHSFQSWLATWFSSRWKHFNRWPRILAGHGAG